MALTARAKGGSDIEPVKEGMHVAVCTKIIDLGTQYSETYNKLAHKVAITWELPKQRIDIEQEDGTTASLPRVMTKIYTMSLHEKANLRKDLESWRGRSFTAKELEGFDLPKLLNAPCTLQVMHVTKADTTYANVVHVLPLMEGMEKPEPHNGTMVFMIEDKEIPEDIPEWIVNMIKASEEWRDKEQAKIKPTNPFPSSSEDLDDVPF